MSRKATKKAELPATHAVTNTLGHTIEVRALDDADARKQAMIYWYGKEPTKVTPNAPDYKGLGLTVVAL